MTRICVLVLFSTWACAHAYIRLVTGTGNGTALSRTDAVNIQFLVNQDMLNPSGVTIRGVTMIPSTSSRLSVMNAINAAGAAWSSVSTAAVRFAPVQSTILDTANDGNHVITIKDTPENVSLVGSYVAVTVLTYSDAGAITDSDIILNPNPTDDSGHVVSYSTSHTLGTYDLQSIITHEMGHALGASHSGLMSAAMFQSAFPFSQSAQPAEALLESSLTPDDVAFVTAVYPAASAGGQVGAISGTVKFAGGAPVQGALMVAVNQATGDTIGGLTSLSSAGNGSYTIAAVPTGRYVVYSEPMDNRVTPATLEGVQPADLWIASSSVSQGFATTFYGGQPTPTPVAVTAGATTPGVDISVTQTSSALRIRLLGVTAPDGTIVYGEGARVVPSGTTTAPVDIVLWGPGVDATITESDIRLLGPGLTVHSGSLIVDPGLIDSTYGTPIHFLVDVAPNASGSPTYVSVAVATANDGASYSAGLVILPEFAQPVFPLNALVSAASYAGGGVSPGEIVYLGGFNFGPAPPITVHSANAANAAGMWDTLLAGTRIIFDGVPAPMYYAVGQPATGGETQSTLAAMAPFELDGHSQTAVQVEYQGVISAPVTFDVVPSHPGLFTQNSKGTGPGSILNQDYSLNTASNPARIRSFIFIYATGGGQTSPVGVDGQLAPYPGPPYLYLAQYPSSVHVTIGGIPAKVQYAGAAPGLIQGALQVNAQIPDGVTSGPQVPIVLTVGGSQSQANVTVAVASANP